MRVGSLFAGIGGFDLGFERAGGFEIAWQCEIDPNKRAALAKWWPYCERFEDITTLDPSQLSAVDVVTAGFPCQDNASCGRRAGLAGRKSGLWSYVPAILRTTRPRYVLVENPPGVLKRGASVVLADLAELGFNAEWDVLPAAVVGSPQLRARVWILAYPSGQRIAPDDTVFAGRAKPDRSAWWATEPALDRVADGFPGWMVGALGDSVVPQIAEWIATRIKEAEGLAA